MTTKVWRAHIRLRVARSPIAGRGVFALEPVAEDAVIETCPLVPVDEEEVVGILTDRVVRTPDGPALPLGFGALYNHSEEPNATWTTGPDVMVVRAQRAIASGEEITIYYGERWFPDRGIEPS